jgi:hypothetical protein
MWYLVCAELKVSFGFLWDSLHGFLQNSLMTSEKEGSMFLVLGDCDYLYDI